MVHPRKLEGKTGFSALVITDAIFAEAADLSQINLGKNEAIRLGDILRTAEW